MTAGVSKSGSPNSRWTTSWPWRWSSSARSNTSTARNGVISSTRLASSANMGSGLAILRSWPSAPRPARPAGHSGARRGLHDLARHRGRHLLVEDARDDVLLVELVPPDDGRDRLGGGELHLVGD